MLSKNQIKYIRSLALKKFREESKQFIAEGTKLVLELISSSYHVDSVYAVEPWLRKHEKLISGKGIQTVEVPDSLMENITTLASPGPVLAVVDIPESGPPPSDPDDLVLLLDDIRDPGNLGTIIRIADWFGISTIGCSETTVDLYNPKVVQSTMGSIARVHVFYSSLAGYLEQVDERTSVYGTFLDGGNIYTEKLEQHGIIVIGSESHGISAEVARLIRHRLFIPGFGNKAGAPESLNAAVATGIICSEFKRRTLV
jgi:RNA methyltransferase, TrmH family